MVQVSGTVNKLEVEDDSKIARVTLQGQTDTFQVTKDSDTGFNGMVSVLASAKGNNIPVTLEHDGNIKIDKIIL